MSDLSLVVQILRLRDIRPEWNEDGLPVCSERCPSFDGKRCEKLGFRPDRICEP